MNIEYEVDDESRVLSINPDNILALEVSWYDDFVEFRLKFSDGDWFTRVANHSPYIDDQLAELAGLVTSGSDKGGA